MKRLLKYLKPHVLTMVIVSVMVLLITVVELYKPIILMPSSMRRRQELYATAMYISAKIMMQLPMMDHSTRCFCTMTATTWRRT